MFLLLATTAYNLNYSIEIIFNVYQNKYIVSFMLKMLHLEITEFCSNIHILSLQP